jgi:hypothetical protein
LVGGSRQLHCFLAYYSAALEHQQPQAGPGGRLFLFQLSDGQVLAIQRLRHLRAARAERTAAARDQLCVAELQWRGRHQKSQLGERQRERAFRMDSAHGATIHA